MQGSIIPGPRELNKFEPAGSLRQAFYQGQALFMINWNTRMKDLHDLIAKGQGPPGSLTNISQVGVVPIPAQAGQPHRYTNIGSFGWAVNRFSVTDPEVIKQCQAVYRVGGRRAISASGGGDHGAGAVPAQRLEKGHQ